MGDGLIRATLGVDPICLSVHDWAQGVFTAEAIEKYRAELVAQRLKMVFK